MHITDFSSSQGQSGAQICLDEVLKLRKKGLERPESKLREKQESKKLPREFPEAPQEPESRSEVGSKTRWKIGWTKIHASHPEYVRVNQKVTSILGSWPLDVLDPLDHLDQQHQLDHLDELDELDQLDVLKAFK